MRVRQSGHIGDLIYSLSAIKKLSELHGPVDLCIGFDRISHTPNHPSGDYTMNDATYKYLLPLLKSLPYIKSVERAKGEVDYDFDKFRDVGFQLGAYDLRRWHGMVYPELNSSTIMSEACIEIEDKLPYVFGKIVIARSGRYRMNIDYSVLKPYEADLIFV